MKALSLWQPWATFIAIGRKTIETRSWSTSHRGPLAIHAAKRKPEDGYGEAHWQVPRGGRWVMLANDPERTEHPLPLGAIVATCRLVDVMPIHEQWCKCGYADGPYVLRATGAFGEIAGIFTSPSGTGIKHPDWGPSHLDCLNEAHPRQQLPYGDFRCGRFAWLLDDVQHLDPIPAVGHQGLWNWDVP